MKLKDKLLDWFERIESTNPSAFDTRLKGALDFIESSSVLKSILEVASVNQDLKFSEVESIVDSLEDRDDTDFYFESAEEHAIKSYYCLKYLSRKGAVRTDSLFADYEDDKITVALRSFVQPLFDYLLDSIDDLNTTLYLLSRYKMRVDYFTKEELAAKYKDDSSRAEQVLEDDLRQFLFDQGIDYPFSQPAAASGRPDIVAMIDTNDPLVLEVKVVDKGKGYGKSKIVGGFSQIENYTNQYNKLNGYLAIFNFDPVEIVFDFPDQIKGLPPHLRLNNRTYFFIVVNMNQDRTASQIGKMDKVLVTKEMLLNNLNDE